MSRSWRFVALGMMSLAIAEACLFAGLWNRTWWAVELLLSFLGFSFIVSSPFMSSITLSKKIALSLGLGILAAALMLFGLILEFLYGSGDIPGPVA